MKKKKRGWLSCINGTKGAISLFMAVLMTPFLTIAMLLVETGRYNSAVSILDEALGVSSMSLLANYDEYLHSRWGLMALDQKKDVSPLYMHYLKENSNVMGQTISINTVKAKGTYPLSDMEVLEYQLMEYCKLNAPTGLATDILTELTSMTDLISKLKSITNLGNVMSLVTNGVNMLDSGITLVESVDKLKECANALDDLVDDYENDYVSFSSKANELINKQVEKSGLTAKKNQLSNELQTLQNELNALLQAEQNAQQNSNSQNSGNQSSKKQESQQVKNKRRQISSKQGEINTVDSQLQTVNSKITNLKKSVNTAKSNYAGTLSAISQNLTTYKNEMASCLGAIEGVRSNLVGMAQSYENIKNDLDNKTKDLAAMKKELERMEAEGYDEDDPAYSAGLDMKIAYEKEVAELQTQKAMYEAAEAGAGEMVKDWDESVKKYSDATIGQYAAGFASLSTKVSNFNVDSVTKDTKKITRDTYKNVPLAGYVKADELEAYLLEQETALKESPLKALISGIHKIYEKLMGVSIFYEGDLSSCINLNYYSEQIGGLPGGPEADSLILAIINDIGSVVSSAAGIAVNLNGWKLLKALKNLLELVKSIKSLLSNLAAWAKELLQSIGQLFTGYEKWYLSIYAAKTMPCRTDYDAGSQKVSFTTMTNHTVSTGSLPEPDEETLNPFKELGTMITKLQQMMKNTGDDVAFTGAELEYILFGSTSEIANQLYVFVVLYLIRLISNIPSIMSNPEVQGLAAASTFGYPVVIALYIFLEPLVQTILLVNGRDQSLIPSTVYLSPSGLPKLVADLVKFCKFTDAEAEELGGHLVEGISKSQGDYDYQKKLAEYKYSDANSDLKKKGKLQFSYRNYCLILLIITVEEKTMLARIANVIQMETLHHYQQKDKSFVFDMNKSYTYLNVEANADFEQILPTLIASSVFSVEREHYRGY